jgi:hypothetical protein
VRYAASSTQGDSTDRMLCRACFISFHRTFSLCLLTANPSSARSDSSAWMLVVERCFGAYIRVIEVRDCDGTISVNLCDIKYTSCDLDLVSRVQMWSYLEGLSRDSASFSLVMGSHVLKPTRNLQEDINAAVGDIWFYCARSGMLWLVLPCCKSLLLILVILCMANLVGKSVILSWSLNLRV